MLGSLEVIKFLKHFTHTWATNLHSKFDDK